MPRSEASRKARSQRLAAKRKLQRALLRQLHGGTVTRKRTVASYPAQYMEIARLAFEGKPVEPITFDDKKLAKATQLDFNRFRSALLDEQHPFYEAARDLIVRITPQKIAPSSDGGGIWRYILEFPSRGMYNLAQRWKGLPELQPTEKDGLPDLRPAPIPEGLDPKKLLESLGGDSKDAESMLEDMYNIRRPADGMAPDIRKATIPSCPPHELDELTDGCIKCKLPRDKWK
jgi:hypothetical protein